MFKVLHLIPGRARLRFDAVKGQPELARRLHTHLEAVTHITRVNVDTRTGSVLLLYDARALRSPAFLDEVSAALGKLFPSHFAPGRVRMTTRRLKGKPELARKLEKHFSSVRGIHRIEIDPTSGSCLLVYDSHVVTSPDFFEKLSDTLPAFLPKVNLEKLLALAGFRWR
jgi:hypothetical protein